MSSTSERLSHAEQLQPACASSPLQQQSHKSAGVAVRMYEQNMRLHSGHASLCKLTSTAATATGKALGWGAASATTTWSCSLPDLART